MIEHEFFIKGTNFKITSGTGIVWNMYSFFVDSWNLMDDNLTKDSDTYSDELKYAVKYIKNHEREKRQQRTESFNNISSDYSDKLGVDNYYFRINNSIKFKLQSLKISNGIIYNSFINQAIAEKLERDNL